jgi:biopolymer transport protein ExbD
MFALSRSHTRPERLRPAFEAYRTGIILVSLALAGLTTGGCKKAENETAPGASAADEVGRALGDLEIPVALRTRDTAPSDAHKVEATTEQLRLNGVPVVPLTKGYVAKEEQPDGVITKLAAALRAQSHAAIALRLEAILPYETLALILNTAKQAGVMNASFQVREPGSSTKTGWLNADSFVMMSKADDVPPILTVTPKSWDAFTSKWKLVTEACKAAPSGNCAYADSNFAKGGTLKIELMSSGRGINVNFFQRGLTPQQEHEEEVKRTKELAKKKEQFLQGHLTQEQMVEYLLLGDPSTQALFQFRYQEALASPSALTSTIAPLCHQEKCGVAVSADKVSPMVRVVSLIGAAFPDGTPSPAFAFEMPWTKKPVPTGLPEWAQREIEKNQLLDGK